MYPYFTGPTIPTELRATAVGAGALNISWRSSCFVRTEIQFSLIAVNLNYSRRTPDMIHRILNLHYTYNITDETSCDVYSIRVTSSNGSISSNVSDSIITSFPSLPDISPLVNSLQHSLFKRSDGVMLTFWFNVSTGRLISSGVGRVEAAIPNPPAFAPGFGCLLYSTGKQTLIPQYSRDYKYPSIKRTPQIQVPI